MTDNFIIENSLKQNNNADLKILTFINNFNTSDEIRNKFMNGYCYYFAHMLKQAFNKGEVCWCVGCSHIVWVYNDVPYDIEGVYSGSANEFIPESFLGEAINDFKHIPGLSFNATSKDIQEIIDKYRKLT